MTNLKIMKYFSYLLLLIIAITTRVSAQQFEWVVAGKSQGQITTTSIASDPSGSVYTVGTYTADLNFSGVTITRSQTGINDIFLVKYASDGSCKWGIRIANSVSTANTSTKIVSDRKGYLYVLGVYSGATTIGSQLLTSIGNYDVFIAKYDTNGNFQWAVKAGSSDFDVASDICMDSTGAIHVGAQWIGSSFSIGSFSINGNSGAWSNCAHIKLQPDGTATWLHKIGSMSGAYSFMESDRYQNLYIVGGYSGSPGSNYLIGSITLSCPEGTNDVFVAKMDSTGQFLWAKRIGGGADDKPTDLSVGAEGTVYLSGLTTGTISFDNITFIRPQGNYSFLASYTETGKLAWADVDSSKLLNLSTASFLTTDLAENLYQTGGFSGSVFFGNDTLKTVGNLDIFCVNYTPDHLYRWAKRAGGVGMDHGRGITVSPKGDIYACGTFSGTSYFDTMSITSSGSIQNAYIAKLFTTRINTNLFTGSYCAGTAISASFTIKGKFEEGNIFSIQLSDTTGSFINSQVIGSLSSTTPTTIIGSLPIDLPASKKYRIRVVGSNPRTIGTDGSFFTVFAAPKVKFDPPSPIKVCNSTFPITVNVTGGKSYEWRDGSTATNRSITTPGWYYVTASNEATCDRTDSIQVVSVPAAVASITPTKPTTFCEGGSVGLIAGGGQFFKWSTGDTVRVLTATKQGWYSVAVTDTNGCSDVDSIFVTVTPAPKISITPDGEVAICPGDSITITATSSPNYLWSTGDTTASIKIGKNGLYYVSTSDSNHCSGTSNTLKVTMNIPPQKPVITRDSNILYTSAPKPLQWYFNGELIPGATDNTLIATKEGNYTVRTTDGNNCSTISDGFAFVFNSVKKQNSITSVIASPNPFNDDLSISITLAKQTDCTVELYSVLGVKIAIIFNDMVSEGVRVIPYNFNEPLPSGSYYLRVKCGDEITTIKLIAE
jgi:hypothetical protein